MNVMQSGSSDGEGGADDEQVPHKMSVFTPTLTQGVPIRLQSAALNWFKGRKLAASSSMSPKISRSAREQKIAPKSATDDRKRYEDGAGRHGG